ncbi:MAG: S-methyl-5-thioribose-1-phosphate isomerase, partial [Candidatus Eremiobacteraeota bacterium]|nr:S-methyl-5-thioribose-1-phosphate isomerase [Candidatus Eremiobacteraeota bacterium]
GLRGDAFYAAVDEAAQGLRAARPTAVNLAWAVDRARGELAESRGAGQDPSSAHARLAALARQMHDDDIAACVRIGDSGAALIPPGSQVLTHCNTGTLATGGYGTALGIIRSAWREGRLEHVLVAETRPLLQGARLTAWELQRDGIPFTLISDSMAAHFMQRKQVGAVVVGADRIASNGDVANKIGTYALAVLARAHDVPFIVAAPLSTFDPAIDDGTVIPIEERSPDEVSEIGGVRVAPPGVKSANPAFDVTPAAFVSAIVSDAGIARAPLGESIAALLGASQRLLATPR